MGKIMESILKDVIVEIVIVIVFFDKYSIIEGKVNTGLLRVDRVILMLLRILTKTSYKWHLDEEKSGLILCI